jgi:hypothetical protein
VVERPSAAKLALEFAGRTILSRLILSRFSFVRPAVKGAPMFGLEGMVSKRRDRPYRPGRSPDWIKVKNPQHPAMQWVKEAFS